MPLFGQRTRRSGLTTKSRTSRSGGLFHRKDKDRVAGGFKAALSNPNTSRSGRKHAKRELKLMGRDTHVPLMTKIKRALGIRSTPRRQRTTKSRFF